MTSTYRICLYLLVALLLPTAVPAAAQDRDQLDEIAEEMEEIRDLRLQDPIDIVFMTREDYEEESSATFLAGSSDEAMADLQRVLVAFGLIEVDADLAELYAGLYAGGIAGYYDAYANQMVVITASEDEEFTAINEVTFAHETVHALQDQNFELLTDTDAMMSGSNDQTLAIRALIEGDASVAETDYLLSDAVFALEYLTEVYTGPRGESVWDTTPPILLLPLSFPYREGQMFVQYLYDEGGWDLVNAAYDNPPTSTEQILHPEKYLNGEEAIEVPVQEVAGALGDGWRVIEGNTWGEFTISIILSDAGLEEDEVAAAHIGWGGDAYVALTDGEETAVAWATAWDTEEDAVEFLDALAAREGERLDAEVQREGDVFTLATDNVVIQIILDGNHVTYLQGPNASTVSDMAKMFGS